MLLHPRFVADGWDSVQTDEAVVKLLNVVPLIAEEARLKKISAILDRWVDHDIDILSPR